MLPIFNSLFDTTFTKFATVGLLGTIVNLLFMAVLVECCSMSNIAASFFAVEVSIIHNFLLNTFWTFSNRTRKDSVVKQFLYFNVASIGTLVITIWISSKLIEHGWGYLVAQATGILVAFAVNYQINNKVIFKFGISLPK